MGGPISKSDQDNLRMIFRKTELYTAGSLRCTILIYLLKNFVNRCCTMKLSSTNIYSNLRKSLRTQHSNEHLYLKTQTIAFYLQSLSTNLFRTISKKSVPFISLVQAGGLTFFIENGNGYQWWRSVFFFQDFSSLITAGAVYPFIKFSSFARRTSVVGSDNNLPIILLYCFRQTRKKKFFDTCL